MANYNLLHTLQFPGDLRKLNPEQQKNLCWELRRKLIRTVSENGGHLASNLGVVELTVALHTVFELPADKIVWDVGHQCYVHKMLTGRLEQFDAIRREGGLSGFPRPCESAYDAFIGGHASTSLSAAFGLARANTLKGDPHSVVAVVGDGAFTGGMIYEALNNAGRSHDNLIVVLNDNNMSISRSVGSLARYLAAKRASEGYLSLKNKVEEVLRRIPVVGPEMRNLISDAKATFRQLMYHSNLFEDFGFDYLGPVDGHDIPLLIQVLNRAKELHKPVVVHVNTVKGKGYTYAEKNPSKFHGVGGFDCASGAMKPAKECFSSVFGNRLVELAKKDSSICAITAAMQDGTGLQSFGELFPTRFYDVGIAEEHAVTFACGLAAGGMLPVFAVYSTFLQRGFDQLIHDASIQRQRMVLAVDRAGLVGDDGETHQGLFDAAFLSEIPGLSLYAPATYDDLRWALDTALYTCQGVAAVRYPRGTEVLLEELPDYAVGDWFHYKSGKLPSQLLLISYGREFGESWKAAKALAAGGKRIDLLKLTRISPLPEACILLAKRYRNILFVEEGIQSGGIGEHFLGALSKAGYRGQMDIRAIEAPFLPAMSIPRAMERCGLDAASIKKLLLETYFQTI